VQSLVTQEVSTQLTQNLLTGLSTIHNETAQAADGAAQLASGGAKLSANTAPFQDGLKQLETSVQQLQTGLEQLSDGSKQIADGNTQLDTYAKDVREIEGNFWTKWSKNYTDIKQRINSSLLLPEAKTLLLLPLDDLSADISNFHSKIGTDLNDIDALADGSVQLENGLQTVVEKMPELLNGISQVEDGFNQISDAISELNSGTDKLNDALTDGYKKIPYFTDVQVNQVSAVVAAPVDIKDSSQASASGYAAGLAPFFISLSAWIGAYTLYVIVSPFQKKVLAQKKNAVKTMIASYMIPAATGISQMTLLYFVVVFQLGLTPAHPLLSLLFMYLTSLTFVMILFVLVALLGEVGLFLGLVLLVMQLTSSGGTFPWQTTPEFFHVLHKIFPMSYAVDAFRHTFYGGNLTLVAKDAVFFCGWFLAAFVLACAVTNKKIKSQSPEETDKPIIQ
jgi:putative membrane protein